MFARFSTALRLCLGVARLCCACCASATLGGFVAALAWQCALFLLLFCCFCCFLRAVKTCNGHHRRRIQTKDNVFVTAVVSVQYQPIKTKVSHIHLCAYRFDVGSHVFVVWGAECTTHTHF